MGEVSNWQESFLAPPTWFPFLLILECMMRSSIKEVWALQFPCHEVLNICSNSSPVSKPTHLHPFFFYPFLPIQWVCPTFSLVSERKLWSLSPFASFHEENGENLYCPIMGHLQIWPRKADFISLWGKKGDSCYFSRWGRRQMPKPLIVTVA